MDFHPLLVHFPIALLSLYCLFELVRIKKILAAPAWFYIKAILVIAGELGAIAALIAGQLIEDGVSAQDRPILHLHADYAIAATIFFGVVALGYLVRWLDPTVRGFLEKRPRFARLWSIKVRAAYLLTDSWLSPILGVIGLTLITIAGALGGILVHGPDVDPITKIVYFLFFGGRS